MKATPDFFSKFFWWNWSGDVFHHNLENGTGHLHSNQLRFFTLGLSACGGGEACVSL